MRHLLILLLAAVAALVPVPARAAPLPRGVPPISGPVTREFDAPDPDWTAGHRGVDLAGIAGAPVLAAAEGDVTFAGEIAGRGVVVVSHGEVRTTYEPVLPLVAVGTHVARGEQVAQLDPGHPGCVVDACLHWGLKRGEQYLDPRLLLGPRTVRLVGVGT